MEDELWLGLRLDFWDDTVRAFEPIKVVTLLQRAFPLAEVDPTDHQQVRLEKELAAWARNVPETELRDSLTRQSWGCYRRNGPTYRFVVPFISGHRVGGVARRLSVGFSVPPELPPEYQEQLRAFLVSLRMGEPEFEDDEESEPRVVSDDPA